MRRRRKRLRIDRILYCIAFLVLFVLLVRFSIYSVVNMSKFNSVKKNSTIKIHKDEVKVWKKTVKYINDEKDDITIKHKKNSVTIDANLFKNGMNVTLNIYNKKINEALFDNVKSLYIEKTDLLSIADKVSIKLPRYLYKNGIVDVYGVKNKEIFILKKKVEVKDKYVTFNTNKMYDDYFVTYVKVKSISSFNNFNLKVGETRNLNIKINPSNATNTDLVYKYKKELIDLDTKKGIITGKKAGESIIKVMSKKEDIIKELKVKVKKSEKETIKEDKKEEVVEQPTSRFEQIDGVTYIDGTLIVNKTYPLPSSYDPGGLTNEFMDAFYEMQAAATLSGINLFIASGYRDYDYQTDLYNKYVVKDGKEAADTYSARPGYSEHQSGLAADINAADSSFNDTPEAKWLAENCYKYGFVIRFPEGKEAYTGYMYESWHVRYVGKELAKKIHDAGDISLEEYFNITSAYAN